MNTQEFDSSALMTHIESGVTPTLHYRFGQLRHCRRFMYVATVKVHLGVRHVVYRSAIQPTLEEMARECLDHGTLCPRPYLVGQDSDGCASDCVFALLEDYCRKDGIDPTELMLRTYPGWETREGWLGLWPLIRAEAEWQGTIFPRQWLPHSVVALMHSIYNLDRRALVDMLLDTIGTRHRSVE